MESFVWVGLFCFVDFFFLVDFLGLGFFCCCLFLGFFVVVDLVFCF